nr:abortive infection family protein [Kineosphaera limosa]
MSYDQLWHLARERLGVLPQQVDPNLPGVEAIRAIHQSTWNIADQINKLRNLQGTGLDRTRFGGHATRLPGTEGV